MEFDREKFKKIRESRGYTHEYIAKRLSISKQSVEHWEAGRSNPKPVRIAELARVLNCAAQEFSDIQDFPERDSYLTMDEKLAFIADSWNFLTESQQSEIYGIVKGCMMSVKIKGTSKNWFFED